MSRVWKENRYYMKWGREIANWNMQAVIYEVKLEPKTTILMIYATCKNADALDHETLQKGMPRICRNWKKIPIRTQRSHNLVLSQGLQSMSTHSIRDMSGSSIQPYLPSINVAFASLCLPNLPSLFQNNVRKGIQREDLNSNWAKWTQFKSSTINSLSRWSMYALF